MISIPERNCPRAPVVERSRHVNGVRAREAGDELGDPLLLPDAGGLVAGREQRDQRDRRSQREAPRRPNPQRDGMRCREPAGQPPHPGRRRPTDRGHHARLDAPSRPLRNGRAEHGGRGLQPRHLQRQLGRQALPGDLAVERLMNPRIDRLHACSSSACSNASRARCTRIFSVGMRSPVTAAISW